MIYSKEEILSFVKTTLGCEDVTLGEIATSGNMTARIEDGGELTILGATVGGKDYVIKMKSVAFETNVGDAMNYFSTSEFRESYEKGKYIFYIRDSVNREMKVYPAFSCIKESLPKIYGAQSDGKRSILLMEKLDISREQNHVALGMVLRKLHAIYPLESEARNIGANVHVREDYINAKALALRLIDSIERVYPTFPRPILERARKGANEFGALYDKMVSYPRCLCHGDLTANNMTTTPSVRLYDFELATYNNPEFDLVSYLVHYPTLLNKEIVEDFLCAYYEKNEGIKKEVLSLNVLLYFITRFNAMMMISKRVNMPYMEVSIQNYIFLFDYFNLASF